jgi:hypothetical protein
VDSVSPYPTKDNKTKIIVPKSVLTRNKRWYIGHIMAVLNRIQNSVPPHQIIVHSSYRNNIISSLLCFCQSRSHWDYTIFIFSLTLHSTLQSMQHNFEMLPLGHSFYEEQEEAILHLCLPQSTVEKPRDLLPRVQLGAHLNAAVSPAYDEWTTCGYRVRENSVIRLKMFQCAFYIVSSIYSRILVWIFLLLSLSWSLSLLFRISRKNMWNIT